jgi:hypothetical protein
MSSLGAGAAVGGISALASGSLSKGITAGLGAYGGSELATGLGNFGAEVAANQAVPALTSGADAAATQQYANQFTAARDLASADKMGSVFGGAKAALNNPSQFIGSMGGLGNVAKNVGMAAAPILTMPTATQMPTTGSQNSGHIRTTKRDPATGALVQDEAVPASQWGARDIGPYNYYGANRMAGGGSVETITKMPGDSDSARAYNYLMGLGPNPIIGGAPALPPKVEEKAKDVAGEAPSGIPTLLPISETGGGNDAGQPGGGWGAKDVSDKAAFWGENPNWANWHEKALNMVPFDTQAKRDEQLAIDMSRTIGPSTTTPEEQATKNTLADQMRAAEHASAVDAAAQAQATANANAQQADVDAARAEGMSKGVGGYGDGGGGGGAEGGGGGGTGSGGPGDAGPRARGGMVGQYAMGGITALAHGGMSSLGSYSDGGRLLRGPGDGVSDDIPAHIGDKMQPARLADGEFVVPARIVSELGNGSTEAGARQLYKMMERIQAGRAKTTGKNKVAVNSRATKHLPA